MCVVQNVRFFLHLVSLTWQLKTTVARCNLADKFNSFKTVENARECTSTLNHIVRRSFVLILFCFSIIEPKKAARDANEVEKKNEKKLSSIAFLMLDCFSYSVTKQQ